MLAGKLGATFRLAKFISGRNEKRADRPKAARPVHGFRLTLTNQSALSPHRPWSVTGCPPAVKACAQVAVPVVPSAVSQ